MGPISPASRSCHDVRGEAAVPQVHKPAKRPVPKSPKVRSTNCVTSAGFDGASVGKPPQSHKSNLTRSRAHSRYHQFVTRLSKGFSHFVTSMTAPIASGWSACQGRSCNGKRRLLTARTPKRTIRVLAICCSNPLIGDAMLRHSHAARSRRM